MLRACGAVSRAARWLGTLLGLLGSGARRPRDAHADGTRPRTLVLRRWARCCRVHALSCGGGRLQAVCRQGRGYHRRQAMQRAGCRCFCAARVCPACRRRRTASPLAWLPRLRCLGLACCRRILRCISWRRSALCGSRARAARLCCRRCRGWLSGLHLLSEQLAAPRACLVEDRKAFIQELEPCTHATAVSARARAFITLRVAARTQRVRNQPCAQRFCPAPRVERHHAALQLALVHLPPCRPAKQLGHVAHLAAGQVRLGARRASRHQLQPAARMPRGVGGWVAGKGEASPGVGPQTCLLVNVRKQLVGGGVLRRLLLGGRPQV